MNFFFFCFFFCFLLALLSFEKKLIFLLSLEMMMIFTISMFFFFTFKSLGSTSFFSSMLFLVFMVLDSVLGICLLIGSCRSGSSFEKNIFFF